MASSLVMSLIGAAGLAAALLVGCGDNDAKPVSSQAGQSCARTADCADGLSCIANVCYSSSSAAGGSGGSGGAAVVGPVLGGEGESCTSRKDCEAGLSCFNQRCTASGAIGAGGDTGSAPTAQLGTSGETCRVNADCAQDLSCVPLTVGASVGVCGVSNYGITPTGMYCGGECSEATDCCQLPVNEQTAEGIKSCPDLTALIASSAVNCKATPENKLCFLDATYCTGCDATVWKCTDNACVYNLACKVAAGTDTDNGCPEYTRLDKAVPTCDAKTLKCTAASGCIKDADCLGLPVADSTTAAPDTCSDGECTCYAGNHQCYRACSLDVQCATGNVCNKKSAVCVPDTECTTDQQCAERNGSIAYKCQQDSGTCALTCATDRDCSPSGSFVNGVSVGTFKNSVCTAGLCTTVAGDCTDDTQCGAVGGYKTFCIARPDLAADVTVSSAVTN